MNGGATGRSLQWQWPAATVTMIFLMLFVSYQPSATASVAGQEVPGATDILAIAQTRCATCHAARPTDADFKKAPKGVMLESVADLRKHSAKILKQTVLTKTMPIANRTKMTTEERAQMGLWIRAGMPDG